MNPTRLAASMIAALGASFAASLALADAKKAEPLTLTYEIFEVAFPHADLAECPAEMAAEDRFCRATLHSEEVHVFAFAYEGEQPLLSYAAYPFAGPAADAGQ